jgi:sirohydrochlorin ferrochelatase
MTRPPAIPILPSAGVPFAVAALFALPLLIALPLLAWPGSLAAQATGRVNASRADEDPVHATRAGGELAPVDPARVGTVVIAHGGGADWNGPVIEAARNADTGGPVAVSFLMGDSAAAYRFQDAVAAVIDQGAERVVVVPLLASSHSGHYEQIRYLAGEVDQLSETMMHHLHMAGIERPNTTTTVSVTPALDASPEIAEVLVTRALELASAPAEQALFVIGHGPNGAEDYAGWMENLRPIADEVGRQGGFRDVKLGLVRDDAPEPVRAEAVRRIREIIALQHELTGHDVVVVPLLISRGYVSTTKLPQDLDGLPVVYDGEGLLPHDAVARWIERRVRETAGGK